MTYNEWRDELKANLLCVSDGERRRVLDYYAEAYADKIGRASCRERV